MYESIIALIPQEIPTYVALNYSKFHITEINIENYGYEIGLNDNGPDLKFDKKGAFIGLDK